MPYSLRLLINRGLSAADGGGIQAAPLDEAIEVGGELTHLLNLRFALGWQEGDQHHPSHAASAKVAVQRRLSGTPADFIAEKLMAGPHRRGDAYVVKARLYEVDTARPLAQWSSVVNEWQLGRVTVTHLALPFDGLLQVIELSCTDIQLVPRAGVHPVCPLNGTLSDPHFIAGE
jgi:hypothetical protein